MLYCIIFTLFAAGMQWSSAVYNYSSIKTSFLSEFFFQEGEFSFRRVQQSTLNTGMLTGRKTPNDFRFHLTF